MAADYQLFTLVFGNWSYLGFQDIQPQLYCHVEHSCQMKCNQLRINVTFWSIIIVILSKINTAAFRSDLQCTSAILELLMV